MTHAKPNIRHQDRKQQPSAHAFTTCALLACFAAVAPGCYERVVSASGLGASSMTIQKTNRSDTALDRWFDKEVLNAPETAARPRTVQTGGTPTSSRWTTSGSR